MLDDRLGRFHFWVTFLGTYLIYFPMHYLGVLGMPRRYYNFDNYQFIPPSAHALNTFITVVALVVGAAQLVYVFNLVWSTFRGRRGRRQPVARGVARVVHAGHAAGARQLGREAAGRLPLGLCLRRAGRAAGLHRAERAARGRRRRAAARGRGRPGRGRPRA